MGDPNELTEGEEESYTDESGRHDNEDSYCSTFEEETEEGTFEEGTFEEGTFEDDDDDDISYEVPQQDRRKSDISRSSNKLTPERQEQQRRLVDLAAASTTSENPHPLSSSYTGSYTDTDGDEYYTDEGYTDEEEDTMDVASSPLGTMSEASRNSASTEQAGLKKEDDEVQEKDEGDDIVANASSSSPTKMTIVSTATTPKASRHTLYSSPKVQHERIPGGAAAKIMLVGPKGSSQSEEESVDIFPASSTESLRANTQRAVNTVAQDLQTAHDEFQELTPRPPQFEGVVAATDAGDDTVVSEAATNITTASTTPSFLNRNEIFHRTASAAITALLSPTGTAASENDISMSSPASHLFPLSSPRESPRHGNNSKNSSSGMISPRQEQKQNISTEKPVNQALLSKEAERKVEQMRQKMQDPNSTLTDLLTAIAAPDEEISDPLHFAVRRKNACGALLTLTTNSKNCTSICWTVGVLPALTSVLLDGVNNSSTSTGKDADGARISTEYEAARNRTISTLLNLVMPVKNRIPVFHTPHLVRALLMTIKKETGTARRGCCAILGFLAKSPHNRLLLAVVPGLLDVVREVLKPLPPRMEPVKVFSPKKQKHCWSDGEGDEGEDDDDLSTASTTDDDESRKERREKKNGPEATDSDSLDKFEEAKENKEDMSVSDTSKDLDYDSSGDTTHKQAGAASPRELTGYDETADELLQAARQNLFAMLGHLVKEKDNAYHFARDVPFVSTLVDISRYQESPSHALAIKILANLTRHRLNKGLAFKPKEFVPSLVEATQSPNDDARLYSCYALQNLSQEKSCRQELAIAEHLIEVLCDRCRSGTLEAERLAAISTLKNLCDEPANLIPMTNTSGCVSTLMHFAHAEGVSELMQFRACDALATLSHWLRKIATSGFSLDASQKGRPTSKGLFVPSLREVSWNQWT